MAMLVEQKPTRAVHQAEDLASQVAHESCSVAPTLGAPTQTTPHQSQMIVSTAAPRRDHSVAPATSSSAIAASYGSWQPLLLLVQDLLKSHGCALARSNPCARPDVA